MNDDRIKLYIPRELVKSEEIHPEEYGDKIVILQNDMWTDVFTDEDGEYYTITNNDDLILYVKSYVRSR